MPSLYELAHMLIRLFAAMYLVIGAAALMGILLILGATLAIGHQAGSMLMDGIVGYLAQYGVAAFISGLGIFLLSKSIARVASKS